MVGLEGLEPSSCRLKVGCSTIELQPLGDEFAFSMFCHVVGFSFCWPQRKRPPGFHRVAHLPWLTIVSGDGPLGICPMGIGGEVFAKQRNPALRARLFSLLQHRHHECGCLGLEHDREIMSSTTRSVKLLEQKSQESLKAQ